MSQYRDLEKQQRTGEELDLTKLMPWLSSSLGGLQGEPSVTQYSGGASNWTYRLKFNNRDLILRRAPLGKKAVGAHNMPREFRLQQMLKPVYPYVPSMLAVCEDEDVLGSSFYLMERLEGVILRKDIPDYFDWNRETVNQLCQSFWDKIIELHQINYLTQGLSDLGKGAGYVERQVVGWIKRYSDAVTWNVPKGQNVMQWLEANIPTEESLCLIHNDFRLDNVVLNEHNPADIVGILDWELATVGDPLMDLGSSLAYWIEEDDNFFIKSIRRQPTHVTGMWKREEIVTYYMRQMGRSVSDFRFYRVYGLFRLAGIVQQIYYRYANGYTNNKSFRNFWLISLYLIKTCERIIKRGSMSSS